MSKYRILERIGTYKSKDCHSWCGSEQTYIPRYIVQEEEICRGKYKIEIWKDLKEFTSLSEARAYKNELELIQGRVRE